MPVTKIQNQHKPRHVQQYTCALRVLQLNTDPGKIIEIAIKFNFDQF